MIDWTKIRLPERRIKYFSAALVLTAQIAALPSLAGNWQGLVQTGLNYAGRAASAAQKARAAKMGSGAGDSGSQQAPPAETSVHAEVRPAQPATPAPAPAPAPVSPPAQPISTESGGNVYAGKWFGHSRRASYSGSNSNPEANDTARSSPSVRDRDTLIPASMQQARMMQARNLHNKLTKKTLVARDNGPEKATSYVDTNPEHNVLRQANNDKPDKPEHKDNPVPANNAAVNTEFIGPLLDKMLDRFKG